MKIVRRHLRLKSLGLKKSYSSCQGWRVVAGRRIFFRSSWEVKFACYLQFLKEKKIISEWEHEPKTFWFDAIKRGTRSYLPDFKITRPDGTHYWVEVKGYMDAKSKTKIKRFQKYYPEEELHVVDSTWFKEQKQRLPMLSKGEEYVD